MNIFVGNMSYETTEDEIRQAFVEMSDPTQASAAIAALNLQELHGRALTVNEARPKGAGGSTSRESNNRHGW